MKPLATSLVEQFRDGEFIEGLFGQYTDQIPLTALGLVIFGAVGMVSYLRTGSIVIPMGLFFLSGSVITALIAPPGLQFIVIGILIAGGGALTLLWWRFSP